jgi:hypothetical protein
MLEDFLNDFQDMPTPSFPSGLPLDATAEEQELFIFEATALLEAKVSAGVEEDTGEFIVEEVYSDSEISIKVAEISNEEDAKTAQATQAQAQAEYNPCVEDTADTCEVNSVASGAGPATTGKPKEPIQLGYAVYESLKGGYESEAPPNEIQERLRAMYSYKPPKMKKGIDY